VKVIIAGSRTLHPTVVDIFDALAQAGFAPREIVSGTASGVDVCGENYGVLYNIPVKRFPADWVLLGRRAGYARNCQMADYADALLAFWDEKSRGTKHMIDIAKEKGLEVHVMVPIP
jgi:hypothetical protein